MSLEQQILAILKERPGAKAKDIASSLSVDKKEVNSCLYGKLRGKVRQDNTYRWHLVDRTTNGKHAPSEGTTPAETVPLTDLGKLCQYYLDCLSQDNDAGVETFATSKYGNPEYVEIGGLPFTDGEAYDPFAADTAFAMYRRIRQDRARLNLYLGYPTRLRQHRSRNGWEGFFVDPLLLFQIEMDDESPRISNDLPILNLKALRWLTDDGAQNVLEEAARLNEELGLDRPQNEAPDIDELLSRLRAVRPEWDWLEEIEMSNLAQIPSLGELDRVGIYNRAILIAGERSPYTQGLETELRKLANLKEADYKDTALGHWLRGDEASLQQSPQSKTLIEVVPLNAEQRRAVEQALTAPLSIITGPPGTGKSQVVTSLLVNAAWYGTKVLFASKNNKAVDVVEERVNGLAVRPTLLRLGANEYQGKLAEYLVGLLAATNTQDDEDEFKNYEEIHNTLQRDLSEISKKLDVTVASRNKADQLERQVANLRDEWGATVFRSASNLDTEKGNLQLQVLQRATRQCDRQRQNILIRILWTLVEKSRFKNLALKGERLSVLVAGLGLRLPKGEPSEQSLEEWKKLAEELADRIENASKIRSYFEALKELRMCSPFEELAHRQYDLSMRLSENSDLLWKAWIKLQPKRLQVADRRLLSAYASVLQMVVSANREDRRVSSSVLKQYYELFPKIGHVLPCWAVTSLSAKGKLPFIPNFFDLLVIDEASQCDIASALPLLFRARRAVIIGDPKQLRHISALSSNKDQRLREKHELSTDYAPWTYSIYSLFNLASGLVPANKITMLRDHHRSHADIIGFSNSHFYDGQLRVATHYNQLRRPYPDEPAVKWTDVRGNVKRPSSGGAVNEKEVEGIVRSLIDLVQRGYTGTIGVVTPFRAQANAIRELVSRDRHLMSVLAQSDFLVDTVHRFQGDERDVMLFSPVVSDGITPGAISFLRANGNLFNVAVTRARALLHVVGDRNAALQSGVDYLSEFARYVSTVDENQAKVQPISKNDLGSKYPAVAHPERVSDWEHVLYIAMYKEGIRAIPQFDVEQYTLDFAIIAGDRRLNIEVDGERYHKDWTGELCRRDQIRNLRLIELGWEVKRFWVYEVRDDLSSCVAWVRKWVESEDINKQGNRTQLNAIAARGNTSQAPQANIKSKESQVMTNRAYSAIARCSVCGEPAMPGDNVCYQCKSD